MGEPGGEDVEEGGQGHEAEQGEVQPELLQLGDGHDAVGVQRPVAGQDHQVAHVSQRGEQERAQTLVQLEGEVRGAGDEAGEDHDVGEAVVDEAAEDAVRHAEHRQEVERGVDGVLATARQQPAGQQHGHQREGVEDEDFSVGLVLTVQVSIT